MPEIIYEPKQIEALHEIQDSLNLLWKLNVVVSEKTRFELVADTNCGRISIPMDEKDSSKLLALLISQRSKLKQFIKTKSSKHRISLDEHDYEILNGSIEGKGNTSSQKNVEESLPTYLSVS